MNWMQNVTASKGYMVLPGNHESECHSPACLLDFTYKHALQNFTAYNARFRMPFQESGACETCQCCVVDGGGGGGWETPPPALSSMLCVTASITPISTVGGAGLNMWYSFNYGNAHFVAFGKWRVESDAWWVAPLLTASPRLCAA